MIESPAPGQAVYDEALFISGSLELGNHNRPQFIARATINERSCAETRIVFARPDGRIADFECSGGFCPARLNRRRRRCALWPGSVILAAMPSRNKPSGSFRRGYASDPYGEVVSPENETLLHRENIYGSGPPIEEPGIEVSNLLHAYLPEGASVVDVGCGAGAYGPSLIASGHEWLGLEANDYCCQIPRAAPPAISPSGSFYNPTSLRGRGKRLRHLH